ncbi:PP2C family protein-serine/threonine phosphatase [Leptospira dzoumogneensis]|uniref:Protein phosphatase n=1 Tax=Leptospira dzoumogneensis TaxID=2484904 RepID=A0A4Z1AJV0_9LEPT|nr:SpoIIE family protein phosphatase [Leptospira dzoumogneensis]TGM99593.1 protein phosphatase [Leptospira dzoumogneensis]
MKQSLILLSSFLFCFSLEAGPIQEGVLQISSQDLAEHSELIPLNGNWQFLYGEFISPEKSSTANWDMLTVPHSWQDTKKGDKVLPREGAASFRLSIVFPEDDLKKEIGLLMPDFASAYKLYYNGRLVYSSGTPSLDPSSEIPKIKSVYLPLRVEKTNTEILVQGSNWINNFGGFWQVPKLGTLEAIYREKLITQSRESFLFGGLLLIGLYHTGLFLFRRKEKSAFYFALFTFLLTLRVALIGNRLVLEIFPDFPWESVFRLEFFSFYTAVPIFLMFHRSLFPEDTFSWVPAAAWVLAIAYDITLLFPIGFFTKIVGPFQIVTGIGLLYVLFTVCLGVWKKREDSLLFLAGFFAFGITVGIDLLWDKLNLRGINLSPYGLLIFTLSQSLVLSRRIARAFRKSEILSENLRITNSALNILKDNLEVLVREKTSELNHSLERIRKDLLVAQRIQKKLFPENVEAYKELKYAVKYLPRDEVGGDFYDIFEVSPGVYRIFLADATGHGVQAALVTMAIKAEYEGIKFGAKDPGFCLDLLDDKFQRKFSSLGTIFSSIIVDIYARENRLVYASAGHPDQILVHSSNLMNLRRTGAIIGLKNKKSYENQELDFSNGDRMFLFSDGVFEQFNSKREAWGESRLRDRISELSDEPIENIPDIVMKDLDLWLGYSQPQDDISLIAIERV